MNFPRFDGENPKLWQSHYENYFEMYVVESCVWVRVATMHFDGVAARWLQPVNHHIKTVSWSKLCSWIHERFGHDQHESLIQQLFHIKQSGSVQAYINSFSELVDQLVAYEHSVGDQRYFTSHFVDGLKDEIKSVVLVQRPIDLDSACTLALLQEEAESGRRKEPKRSECVYRPKPLSTVVPLPLPPPPKSDKAANTTTLPDQRVKANQADGKVAALRAYRRERGHCQYCAEKWSRGHKCAPTV
jgi:hypothetical protein